MVSGWFAPLATVGSAIGVPTKLPLVTLRDSMNTAAALIPSAPPSVTAPTRATRTLKGMQVPVPSQIAPPLSEQTAPYGEELVPQRPATQVRCEQLVSVPGQSVGARQS